MEREKREKKGKEKEKGGKKKKRGKKKKKEEFFFEIAASNQSYARTARARGARSATHALNDAVFRF